MREIILSTDNENKVREIKEILEPLPLQVLSKREIGLEDLDVVEDQDTLEGNAYIKAKVLYDACRKTVLADDTGLFVDALDGAPGVHSARFAGPGCTEKDNRIKLLRALEGLPLKERGARFETCVVCIDHQGNCHSVRGEVRGTILTEERGNGGFGYDSLFLPDGWNKTFSEMTEEEKNACSHRKRALDAFVSYYEQEIGVED